MTNIKPIGETKETVTLSRADFEAMLEELEDAEDRVLVLEDCLEDAKPGGEQYLLTMAETMRLIDGENPIRVWREKRGMSLTQLANAVGLHDADLADVENGKPVGDAMLFKLSHALDVLGDQLRPVIAVP